MPSKADYVKAMIVNNVYSWPDFIMNFSPWETKYVATQLLELLPFEWCAMAAYSAFRMSAPFTVRPSAFRSMNMSFFFLFYVLHRSLTEPRDSGSNSKLR